MQADRQWERPLRSYPLNDPEVRHLVYGRSA
jgi:hypothetical protein